METLTGLQIKQRARQFVSNTYLDTVDTVPRRVGRARGLG